MMTLVRFARAFASGWRRDPEFRPHGILVFLTLLGGTIFYSLEEGWSMVDAFYFTIIYIFAGLGLILGFIDAVAQETLRNRARRQSSGEGQDDATGS
jgi:voltage-gated potassium channel